MKTHLLLDVHYLAYRSFHSIGHLSFDDYPTGVLYGIFRDVLQTMERFQTHRAIWCFDHGRSKRHDILPEYKSTRRNKRKEASEDEKQRHKEMKEQIKRLRTDLLPRLGFKNVFAEEGYEGDDLIAAIAKGCPKNNAVSYTHLTLPTKA